MNRPDDIEVLKEGGPFIRSILAFIVYLRYGGTREKPGIDGCYQIADAFMDRLTVDLEKR